MLTRQAINSGEYLDHFESLPNLWKTERIERSLAETMKSKPAEANDVWIFAYGSLMWNPMVHFDRRQVATLHGWHRSFCLRMDIGRASPEMPGRMLGLESGGHTHGVALKLSPPTMEQELGLVWIREMVLGSYKPTWAPVTLDDATETHAIAFVADTSGEQYAIDSCVSTVAPLVAKAAGKFGSNAEYLFKLQAALDECSLHDPYIDALADEVQRLSLCRS
ncbi:Glutathione-specific gamma-glutamylcyclotransferase (plasmid) [Caballeronia sp. SBC1]|uniref:gamma-glutamylcyclotransferase n=1 Tax=unclassified Caballeronia TaxID=2646786 RepID=UPI0013E128D8|nr:MULTISPECIES: gamma-glutamylcyclotransferase [unclassified Caballeronia]QIE26264.1 Glutathione-specific gamma-glutamylcyclotransferase [Caballeronia sp. SBC2]QIN64423.1 Glutathione-specific gamma-glutamylcyclotransferase [Caballeronia sp. SBC1]